MDIPSVNSRPRGSMGSLSSIPNRQAPQANMNDPDYSGYSPTSPIKPSSGLMGFVESLPELWASLDFQGKAKVVGLSIVGLWAVLAVLGSLLSGGGRTSNNSSKQMPNPNTNFAAQLTAIQLDARDLRAQVDTLQILSNDLRSMGGAGNLVERLKSLEASLDARTRSIVDEVRKAVDGRIGAFEKSTGERYSFLQSQVDELKGSISTRYDTLQRDMARMEKTYGRRLAEQGLSLKDVFAELSNLSDDVRALQVDVKGLQAPGRRYAEPVQERKPDHNSNLIAKFSSSGANADSEVPGRRHPEPVQERKSNNKPNPISSFFGSSSVHADSEPAPEPRGGRESTDPSEDSDKPPSILSSLFGSAARRAEIPEKPEARALPTKSKPSPKKIEDRSPRLQKESISENDREKVPLFEGSLWEALKASYDRVVQSPSISRSPEELPVNKVPLPEGADAPDLPVALRSTKDEVFLITQSPPMDLDEIEENAKMYMRSMEWTSKGWDNLTLWFLIGLVTVSLWWPFALSENSAWQTIN